MKIRMMSDLHLEFCPYSLPIIDDESNITLILAGDIGLAEKPSTLVPFITEHARRHNRVLMILGNHEHYGCSFVRSKEKIIDSVKDVANVTVMEKQTFIDTDQNVAFIGATLWTDGNHHDPLSMYTIESRMNDFRVIRTGPSPVDGYKRKFKITDAISDHDASVKYIFNAISEQKAAGRKVVVFTHHGPSFKSVHPQYANETYLNGGYVSALDENIIDNGPSLWIHGHVHNSFDYMIGDTRVLTNPAGYPYHKNPHARENTQFDPNLVIEI